MRHQAGDAQTHCCVQGVVSGVRGAWTVMDYGCPQRMIWLFCVRYLFR